MLMRREPLGGGLFVEEFVWLRLGPGGTPVAATAHLYAENKTAPRWGRLRPRQAVGLSQLASSALTSLVACTSALRRAILGHGDARGRLRPLPSLHGRPAPFPARAPYPSIQSTYSKGRASRGFVLRGCLRKADEAWGEASLSDGLADTRFFRRRTLSTRGSASGSAATLARN